MRQWPTATVLAVLVGLSGPALGQGLSDVRIGNEAYREGRYVEAVQAYSQAIDSGALEGEALAITYNNRGVAYSETGAFENAIEDYRASLELRPDDTTTVKNLRVAYVRRGVQRSELGDFAAAVEDYDRAIEIEPGHHLAYLRRGQVREDLGEFDTALSDYERAAALAPQAEEARQAVERVRRRVAELEPLETLEAAEPADDAPEPLVELSADDRPAPGASVAAAEPEAPATEPEAQAAEPEVAAVGAPEPAAPPAAQPVQPGGEVTLMRSIRAVNFRAGPGNEHERLGAIDEGVVVEVSEDVLGWKRVKLPNGQEGWIYRRHLEDAR